MKKIKSKIIVGCIIVFVIGSFFLLYLTTHQRDYFKRPVDEWDSNVESGKVVVTVVGASWCGHCQEYKPHIKTIADKYKINLFFYEQDTLSEEDKNKLLNSFELPGYQGSVPYTVVFKDGKAINSTEGFKSEEATIDFLKENGVIKN